MTSYLVGVYLEDRQWGGPEEGGWWYDVGRLVRVVKVFRSETKAVDYCGRLNKRLRSRGFGPNVGHRDISSVLSEGEYSARVYDNAAPKTFPDRRPHYE